MFGNFNLQWIKEALAICLQTINKFFIDFFFQRLYVDCFSLLIDYVMQLAFVCLESLPFLLVIPKPLSRLWFFYWLKHWDYFLKRLFQSIWQAWQRTQRIFPIALIRHFEKFLHKKFLKLIWSFNLIDQRGQANLSLIIFTIQMGKVKQSNSFGGSKNKPSNNQPSHKSAKPLRAQKPKQKYEAKSKPISKNVNLPPKDANKKDNHQSSKQASIVHQKVINKPQQKQKQKIGNPNQENKIQVHQPKTGPAIINSLKVNQQKLRGKSVDRHNNQQIPNSTAINQLRSKKAMPAKQKIDKVTVFLKQLQGIVEAYEQPQTMDQKYKLIGLITYFEDKYKERAKKKKQTQQFDLQEGQL